MTGLLRLLSLLAIVCVACNSVQGQSAEAEWLTDFEQAKTEAADLKLPILVDFTGSDWCVWCVRLEKEVFSQKAFIDYAGENLVLLMLDFPRRKRLPDAQMQRNRQLAQQYGVRGFPTVLILDSTGKEIGRTGYRRGGAKAYVEHLKEFVGKTDEEEFGEEVVEEVVEQERIFFKSAGFSIVPLPITDSSMAYQSLVMALPPTENFAPNINIQIQPYADSIENYIALSRSQFKSLNFNAIQLAKEGMMGIVCEYTGNLQGRSLHWYARGYKQGNRVYLATATATENQWSQWSAALKKSVDSFKANGFPTVPLEPTTPPVMPWQVVATLLPPSGGFSPNVSVQIQPYQGTVDEYIALSQSQFKMLNFDVVDIEKMGDNGLVCEYAGNIQGKSLHWYTKGYRRGNQFYLATAMATTDQWDGVQAQLRSCVDSFRLD